MEPDAVGDEPAGGVVKLDAEAAIAIFLARGAGRDGVSKALAKQYNLTTKAVRDVWNRRTWGQVTRPYWTRDDERKHWEKIRCSECKSNGVASLASACAACATPRCRGRPRLPLPRNSKAYFTRAEGPEARPLCSMFAESLAPWGQQGNISGSDSIDNIPAHSTPEISGNLPLLLPSYNVRAVFPFPSYEAHLDCIDMDIPDIDPQLPLPPANASGGPLPVHALTTAATTSESGHAAAPAAARQDRCGPRFDEEKTDYAGGEALARTFLCRDSSWPLDDECPVIDTAPTPTLVCRSALAHGATNPGQCSRPEQTEYALTGAWLDNLPPSRPDGVWQLHAAWLEPGEQLETEPEFDAVLAHLVTKPMP